MKQTNNRNRIFVEYESIREFLNYIQTQETNDAFKKMGRGILSSQTKSDSSNDWSGTKDFETAIKLCKGGWSSMASDLTKRLAQMEKMSVKPMVARKAINSVAGYQPIVPAYLNNQPNAMIRNVSVAKKQKVITINKSIAYSSNVKSTTIEEESTKSLLIVKKLESQGYRVNLNLLFGSRAGGLEIIVKVKLKNANERMNISKLAFPLVHPAMLRRLFLRFVETYPFVTKQFVYGHGSPVTGEDLRDSKNPMKGEYILPEFYHKDINNIKSIDDL